MHLFSEVQVIRQPFPSHNLVNSKTWLSVCQRCEEQETPEDCTQDNDRRDPAAQQALSSDPLPDRLR
jgi:hypothetical protein